MPQPQPSNLDHGRSQPRIAGLGDALVPMDRSALPRCGGQSGIGGNLLSVAERAEQAKRTASRIASVCDQVFGLNVTFDQVFAEDICYALVTQGMKGRAKCGISSGPSSLGSSQASSRSGSIQGRTSRPALL